MLRSIQAECFKVVHRPYFWITTILCALFSVAPPFCAPSFLWGSSSACI